VTTGRDRNHWCGPAWFDAFVWLNNARCLNPPCDVGEDYGATNRRDPVDGVGDYAIVRCRWWFGDWFGVPSFSLMTFLHRTMRFCGDTRQFYGVMNTACRAWRAGTTQPRVAFWFGLKGQEPPPLLYLPIYASTFPATFTGLLPAAGHICLAVGQQPPFSPPRWDLVLHIPSTTVGGLLQYTTHPLDPTHAHCVEHLYLYHTATPLTVHALSSRVHLPHAWRLFIAGPRDYAYGFHIPP